MADGGTIHSLYSKATVFSLRQPDRVQIAHTQGAYVTLALATQYNIRSHHHQTYF